MTAGYDASRDHEESGSTSERLGPLPPRMNSTGSFPTVPVAPPAFSHAPGPGHMPPPMPQVTGAFPARPISVGPPPQPYVPPRPRGGALGRVAFVLVVLLLLVAGGQAYLIYRLNHRIDATNAAAAKQHAADTARLEGLEGRAKALEQKTGSSLNTSDVASAVLPSVFRVETPEALGTAFAIGKAPAGGGTDLLTNNHVVTDYYATGGRDVALTRDNLRFTATIVKVDPTKDLALLHTSESFPRLSAQTTLPGVGDPVLAIGAPLGLSDSVTSGVISAYRDTTDGQRLQFDAPINPGNSGGPVVNAKKAVVGIATAKAQDAEGIGLAIPIKVACDDFSIC